ncbi:MAG: transposase [Planctomycetota bacterium]
MAFDPKKHHRRSIRMPGHDYAEPGPYFVTVCARDQIDFFGAVVGEAMHENDAGRMVDHWWHEIPEKFPLVGLDVHVVMPNHTHAVLMLGMTRGDDGRWEFAQAWEDEWSPLGAMLQWFKTMTTNAYIHGVKAAGWRRFPGKLWHRNYWEHVAREAEAFQRIAEYVRTNPARWAFDRENPHRQGDDPFDLWLDTFRRTDTEKPPDGDGASDPDL